VSQISFSLIEKQIAEIEAKQTKGEELNADQLAKLGTKRELQVALKAC